LAAGAGVDFAAVGFLAAVVFLCFDFAAAAPLASLPQEPLPHAESFPLLAFVLFSAMNMVPELVDFAIACPVTTDVPAAILRVASNARASSDFVIISSTLDLGWQRSLDRVCIPYIRIRPSVAAK
jgi:hypothetical protein